jgi:hypothetical protein
LSVLPAGPGHEASTAMLVPTRVTAAEGGAGALEVVGRRVPQRYPAAISSTHQVGTALMSVSQFQ